MEDTVTGRFVQFARQLRPTPGGLLFDVPTLNVVLVPCPDPATGAVWAAAVLAHDLRLPPDAALRLVPGGDAAN